MGSMVQMVPTPLHPKYSQGDNGPPMGLSQITTAQPWDDFRRVRGTFFFIA